MKPTLLILAAGMGSRYGGLKQLDAMGPNGETILDYSINFAASAGYGKAVLVIRESMYEDVQKIILPRYKDIIDVQCVFQELTSLPENYTTNPARVKPYGTAHAILVARSVVNEPFTVINADDFYGCESFEIMAKFLSEETSNNEHSFAMAGYKLSETLSENGTVSRGICAVDENGLLTSVTEMRKISKEDNAIFNNENGAVTKLTGEEFVSMNFWGFSPLIFNTLDGMFKVFLENNKDNITAEFPIPDVVTNAIITGEATVAVLPTPSKWFGVTYAEDRPIVVEKLKNISL